MRFIASPASARLVPPPAETDRAGRAANCDGEGSAARLEWDDGVGKIWIEAVGDPVAGVVRLILPAEDRGEVAVALFLSTGVVVVLFGVTVDFFIDTGVSATLTDGMLPWFDIFRVINTLLPWVHNRTSRQHEN